MSEVTDTSTPADNRTTHEVVAFIEQHARMGAGHTALWRGAIARLNSHDALVAENAELRRKVDEYREALAIALTPPTDEEIAAALKAAKGEA
jgi:hypothetical protein